MNEPVVLSSTYVNRQDAPRGEGLYARLGTETWLPFEETLGTLEGARHPALLFGSGMAAAGAVLDLVTPGGLLVVPRHAYHAVLLAARRVGERSDVRVVSVDITDTGAVVTALEESGPVPVPTPSGPIPALVWLESPTNPTLELADIAALSEAAHARGALVAVDNTFATPLAQRPFALGADIIVHSATKYLAGHSDVVLGAVLAEDAEIHRAVRERRDIGGAIAGPWEAWLAQRGLRTLALRVERSQLNALVLAQRLQDHPGVAEIRHPGLRSHPQHDLAAAQMSGFGSIITLRPHGGQAAADALTAAVRLWVPATSLGGVESSLERRRRFATEAPTIPEDLLRLSVGIEDVEDLWDDLKTALEFVV